RTRTHGSWTSHQMSAQRVSSLAFRTPNTWNSLAILTLRPASSSPLLYSRLSAVTPWRLTFRHSLRPPRPYTQGPGGPSACPHSEHSLRLRPTPYMRWYALSSVRAYATRQPTSSTV